MLRTRALIHSAVILVSIGAFASVLPETIAPKLTPSVDCLDTEPPIAAELDPRQVAPLEEPVDSGGMDPKIIGQLFYRQQPGYRAHLWIDLPRSPARHNCCR